VGPNEIPHVPNRNLVVKDILVYVDIHLLAFNAYAIIGLIFNSIFFFIKRIVILYISGLEYKIKYNE